MRKHFNIVVGGLVQGVFFRVYAKKEAEQLNLKGFSKNQNDGSVYIEVEGDKKSLGKFLSWCKKGSTLAKVDNIKISEGKLQNFKNFKIIE